LIQQTRTILCLANQVRALPRCVAFHEFVDTRRVVEIAPLSVPSPDGSAASPTRAATTWTRFRDAFTSVFSRRSGASNLNSNARSGIRRSRRRCPQALRAIEQMNNRDKDLIASSTHLAILLDSFLSPCKDRHYANSPQYPHSP
jgi:hypothetical protein